MFLLTYLQRLSRRPSKEAGVPRHTLGAAEFQYVLECERMRADRSGQVFGLLSMELQHPRRDRYPLARILRGRLRFTDIVGQFPDGATGVILPDTSLHGARSVAAEIEQRCHNRVPLVRCGVYCYPPAPVEDDSQDSHTPGPLLPVGRSGLPVDADSAELLLSQRLPRWKRAIDLAGSALGLTLASPLLAVVAVAIRLDSPGPILFRQQRSGLGGRPFTIYKFRTMVVDAEQHQAALRGANEQDGPAFKLHNDPRVTRIGKFLRTTSIDELPQLWNVFRGDMSLVGPRPLPCHESAACQAWQRRRLAITPGLTGIWQVHGRSRVTFDEWMRMDLQYLRQRSLGKDLKLLAQTITAVLSRRGAC